MFGAVRPGINLPKADVPLGRDGGRKGENWGGADHPRPGVTWPRVTSSKDEGALCGIAPATMGPIPSIHNGREQTCSACLWRR